MGNLEFVTVKIQIGNQARTVKMQKGTSFKNKSGIFTADKDGATIKMANYEMKAFEAVANNVKEQGIDDGIVLSSDDIKAAQQKYKQGGFVSDMSEFLPDGYRIERPKMSSNDKYIEAYVTNGKDSKSTTLRFAYGDDQQQVLPQSDEAVIKPGEIKDKPHKYMLIENGKIVLSDKCDLGDRPAFPYVKNGTVKVEYNDCVKTFTYKDGHLLKYQLKVTKDQEGLYTLHEKGDYQNIEFYPNGNIKSVDTSFSAYGDFDYVRFTCNYDQNGKFISGKEKFSIYENWQEIDANVAKNLMCRVHIN